MILLLDITHVIPQRLGNNTGLCNYLISLLMKIDSDINNEKLKIICIKNSSFNVPILYNIEVVNKDIRYENMISRIKWVNVELPKLCKIYNANYLHRFNNEYPLFGYCKPLKDLHKYFFKADVNIENINQIRFFNKYGGDIEIRKVEPNGNIVNY